VTAAGAGRSAKPRGPVERSTRLLLWRHGRTAWNAEGRIQGQHDAKLDETGRAQARAAAKRLAARKPDAIVSSDLSRASDTAAELVALTGLTPTYDVRLRERAFGAWETLLASEIEERWPDGWARWRRGEPIDEAGVERIEHMTKRAGEALLEIVERHPGETVVLVTHGGVVRHGIEAVLEWPVQVVYSVSALSNCHWSELRFHPARGWRLHAHNVGD
jgi:glucosyl-3-phosphoglycerate phosphatase